VKYTLEAVYENGIFRPLRPPELPEGQQVRLMVETAAENAATDVLRLAAQVYEGLSGAEIDEVERIALNRQDFFRGRGS